jgi:hypothetical protein
MFLETARRRGVGMQKVHVHRLGLLGFPWDGLGLAGWVDLAGWESSLKKTFFYYFFCLLKIICNFYIRKISRK